MPNFKVYGIDTETGLEATVQISAANPDEAEIIARHRRLAVSRVVEVASLNSAAPQHETIPERKERQKKVYVEQTSKWIKFLMLCSVLVSLIGIGMATHGYTQISDPASGQRDGSSLAWGLLLLFVGLVAFIVLRIVRWWQHG